jgi:hypothetical protein
VGQLDSGEIEGGKQQHVLCKLRQQMAPRYMGTPSTEITIVFIDINYTAT